MKNVSIMCFHDELCQVFNALMTALSLLCEGSKVTLFFKARRTQRKALDCKNIYMIPLRSLRLCGGISSC